jgi:hypothetical protein
MTAVDMLCMFRAGRYNNLLLTDVRRADRERD